MTESKNPAQQVDVDTGHDYDGIRELDNRLPNWWLAILYLSILFSIGYWLYYHTLGVGPDSFTRYEMEMAEAEALHQERLAARGELTDEALAALAEDPAKVESGKSLYAQYCVACHGPDGGGTIGPNLTDDYWMNGTGKPTEIRKIIADGIAAKGMPAWETVLGVEKVDELTAYLETLKGTNVPGKEPQGEIASR